MNGVNLIHISSEDGEWEGLYVDGRLFAEDHSIRTHDWINLIQQYRYFSGSYKHFYFTEEQMDELICLFPKSISDIPKEFFKEE